MRLAGEVRPPGDKSLSHRIALLCLAARGACRVEGFSPCADCASSLAAVRALGGAARPEAGGLVLEGPRRLPAAAELDCGNSGTTLRLLSGLLAGKPGRWRLDGDPSLRRRPMQRVAEPLARMGAEVETTAGCAPVSIRGGGLKGLDWRLPVASAQLKSALLLAGLAAQGPTRLSEPAPSREHTERLLQLCGADLTRRDGAWLLRPSELRLPPRCTVPGDPSSAAFFLCAAACLPHSRVTARGVLLSPGRTGFVQVLQRMGAEVTVSLRGREPEPWGDVNVAHAPGLAGCRVEAAEIPGLVDEVPALALTATQAEGTTVFCQVAELRVKESDRAGALLSQLGRMGARLELRGQDLWVHGPTRLAPAPGLDSLGDHRMAMTLALAGLLAGAPSPVAGRECAAISYPGFYRELERLAS